MAVVGFAVFQFDEHGFALGGREEMEWEHQPELLFFRQRETTRHPPMADNPPIPASTLATLQQTESEDNWTQILSTITALPPLLVCSKPTHAKLLNLRTYILSDRSKLARNAMLLLTRLPLSLVEPLLPPLLKNSAKANHLYVSTARDVLRHLIDLHGIPSIKYLFKINIIQV